MVRLNLSSDNVRNCDETTTFVNESEKIIKEKGKKKGIFNLAYKQGILFKKSKDAQKFKELYEKNGVSKTRKCLRKVSKSRSDNEFKKGK